MLQVALYYRKSTDDGKRQKASIEDQKKWAHEYLSTMQDYNIVAEYEEKQSAKAPGRPLFNDLMSKIYAGQVDTVIVWAVDRLSRNEIDEGAIKWAVRSGKLKQIITRDATYTENELFAMGIFLSMSAEEIATMRKRILRRMDNMVLKEGKVPFHAPYAYKNIGEGMVEVVPEEQEVVQKIFQLRIDGMSYQMIADILNDEGIPTRSRNIKKTTGKWSKSIIEYIIKNEFYIGVVKFMDKIGEGIYEKFITRDIFEQANHGNSSKIARKPLEFPLKGILQYTGGKTLTATRKKGKYVYYHTNDWSFRVTQREIFEKLEKIIAQWIIPEDILPMVRDYIENQLFSEQKAINEEKNRYEKKMQDLVVQEFNLTSIFSKGKISEEMFDLQKQEIFAEKDKIQEKINKLSAFETADLFKFEKIIELVSNLLPAYKNGDEYTKGLIVRAGFIELLIDDEKALKIKEKEPFYWLSLLNVQCGRGSWTGTSDQSVMSRLL